MTDMHDISTGYGASQKVAKNQSNVSVQKVNISMFTIFSKKYPSPLRVRGGGMTFCCFINMLLVHILKGGGRAPHDTAFFPEAATAVDDLRGKSKECCRGTFF
jgi:hypothetical protein